MIKMVTAQHPAFLFLLIIKLADRAAIKKFFTNWITFHYLEFNEDFHFFQFLNKELLESAEFIRQIILG